MSNGGHEHRKAAKAVRAWFNDEYLGEFPESTKFAVGANNATDAVPMPHLEIELHDGQLVLRTTRHGYRALAKLCLEVAQDGQGRIVTPPDSKARMLLEVQQ